VNPEPSLGLPARSLAGRTVPQPFRRPRKERARLYGLDDLRSPWCPKLTQIADRFCWSADIRLDRAPASTPTPPYLIPRLRCPRRRLSCVRSLHARGEPVIVLRQTCRRVGPISSIALPVWPSTLSGSPPSFRNRTAVSPLVRRPTRRRDRAVERRFSAGHFTMLGSPCGCASARGAAGTSPGSANRARLSWPTWNTVPSDHSPLSAPSTITNCNRITSFYRDSAVLGRDSVLMLSGRPLQRQASLREIRRAVLRELGSPTVPPFSVAVATVANGTSPLLGVPLARGCLAPARGALAQQLASGGSVFDPGIKLASTPRQTAT